METVYSKRHYLHFYVQLMILVFLGLGTGIFFIGIAIVKKNDSGANGKEDLLILFGLIIILTTAYSIRRFIKKTPVISLKGNKITIGNRQFDSEDIDTIDYNSQQHAEGLNTKHTGMKISLKNGDTCYIFDRFYSDGHIMKQHIKHLLEADGKSFKPIKIGKVEPSILGNLITYKGIFLINFRILMIFGIMSFPIFRLEGYDDRWPVLLFPAILLFVLSLGVFNYFELNSKHLQVRSHLKFWKKTTYRTEDILEVIMQPNGRAPYSLILVLKDFSTQSFTAASLSSNKWKELQTALEKLNITVRNTIS